MMALGGAVAAVVVWRLARLVERHRRARRDLRAVWWTLRGLVEDLWYLTGALLRVGAVVALIVLAFAAAVWAAVRR